MSEFAPSSPTYRNNPNLIYPEAVPLNADELERDSRLKHIATHIVSGWSGAKPDSLDIAVLQGGLTNCLYIIHNRPLDEKVIARIFGSGTDLFIDRHIENQVFAHLSAHGFAPEFHGLFQNGRIEGFLRARNLLPTEFSRVEIMDGISATLSCLHQQHVHLSDPSPIWGKLKHIMRLLEGISFQDPERQAVLASQINLPDLADRAQRLQQLLIDTEATLREEASSISMFGRGKLFGLDVVFTHNDLLAGNVLIPLDFYENPESRKDMKFIDYEYAGYNPRAFDIANHFCEFAGFDFDIENNFPDNKTRIAFISLYLRDFVSAGVLTEETAHDLEFLRGFEGVVLTHCLLSNLFWGCWAVLQASISTIDFDFLDYAGKRIAAFHRHRKEFHGEAD